MGHALDETLQDILIRYKRMEGYNCLWLPGTDHAAIATEVKIVEKLKQQGIEKKDLTREQFLEKAWEWKKEYGGTILNQLKKLGCSCDWSRERFTMDEGLSNAVKYVFIKLYEKGLIYKGKRMINWCPSCNTSISDAEVEFEEEPTHLWHIRYKVKDEDKYLIVATTRPETMLGDTGVAVHPEDERYKDLVGKKAILPIMNKEIPIVADDFVEKEFGTGAVKLTPAHDPNDYAASQRHNLEIIEVFDENWKMGNLVPEYKGLDIYEARKRIVEKLQEIGALVKIEDYTHNVGKCYRCHHTIEPKISEQWFVKMKPLAEPAIKAVKDGKTRFIPERFDKIYYNWMDNIQDWCISRQLWWGHRIPAYYCTKCNNIMVTESIPHKCEKCGNTELTLEEDTYFGSHPPKLPNEDNLADIEEQGFVLLKELGFNRYEVSVSALWKFSAAILIKRKGLQERQLISFCLTHLLRSWQALSLFRLALHSVFNQTQVLRFFSLLFRIYLTV